MQHSIKCDITYSIAIVCSRFTSLFRTLHWSKSNLQFRGFTVISPRRHRNNQPTECHHCYASRSNSRIIRNSGNRRILASFARLNDLLASIAVTVFAVYSGKSKIFAAFERQRGRRESRYVVCTHQRSFLRISFPCTIVMT